MNWWHRGEERYIEYGTSFGASRAFGIRQSLTDTIYNMNLEHLSRDVLTVFERLDDADVRTAGTTYLMYRGRHRHEPSVDTALTRLAHTVFGLPTWGPKELFYADLFASRKTPCRSQLGLPGVRDQHSGCVAEYLVENDLFDFLLLSLPDNDTHSHKYGPFAQVDSLAAADKQIQRMMDAAGGIDAFLEDHAVIVCSDHSQSKVESEIDLFRAFDGFGLRAAQRPRPDSDEIAVCPSSRSAQVYVLDRDRRRGLIPRVERTLLALEGVDLVMRMGDHPDGEVVVRGERARGVQRAALPATRRPRRRARRALERGGRPRPARADRGGRARALGHLPRRAHPGVVGAALPVLRRGAGLGPPGLRVPRLGRRPPRRRRLARLAARQRLAGHAAVVRDRSGQGRARAVDAAGRRPAGPRPLRACTAEVAAPARSTSARRGAVGADEHGVEPRVLVRRCRSASACGCA